MREENRELNLYLRQVKRNSFLSREKEKYLFQFILNGNRKSVAQRAKEGDKDAQEQLTQDKKAKKKIIESHLWLVWRIAKSYCKSSGLELFDLIQEGNIALFRAIDKFDISKGFRFETYAKHWIKANILDILPIGTVFTKTQRSQQKIKKIKEIKEDYFKENGCSLSDEELSLKTEIPVEEIKDFSYRFLTRKVFLDKPIKKEHKDRPESLINFVVSNVPDPEKALQEKELKEKMSEILSMLDYREKETIERHYGIGRKEQTLDEIGQEFGGLSRERIRQIERKAISKLQRGKKREMLEGL